MIRGFNDKIDSILANSLDEIVSLLICNMNLDKDISYRFIIGVKHHRDTFCEEKAYFEITTFGDLRERRLVICSEAKYLIEP